MQNVAVPVTDPHAQYISLRDEILTAISRVGDSGFYILGPEVRGFEEEFGKYLGGSFCVGVGNGTDALAIALRAVGVGSNDEVLTVSHSAVATAAAIRHIEAIPVFVDIDPVTRCIDPVKAEEAITKRTKAIIPVHIFGHPAPMVEILSLAQKFNLRVVEDCAQAHGASIDGKLVGTFGDAAAFSFYPTKNLGALGDGGLVCANSEKIAERARLIAQYGWRQRYISECDGVNSRLDELQAAILRCKLRHLDSWNNKRRVIADFYRDLLSDSDLIIPQESPGSRSVYHLYVIETEDRDRLRSFLLENGVQTALHYPVPIHKQPAYLSPTRCSLPETERLYERIVSLPIFPELDDAQLDRIQEAFIKWFKIKSS